MADHVENSKELAPLKKPSDDFLPIREYLDKSVMPLLTKAMDELAKQKFHYNINIDLVKLASASCFCLTTVANSLQTQTNGVGQLLPDSKTDCLRAGLHH